MASTLTERRYKTPHPPLPISASQHFSIYSEQLLTRLVALNHERAAKEKRGHIRWLRPDYQNPTAQSSHGRGTANAERRPPLQAIIHRVFTGDRLAKKIHEIR